MAQPPGSGPGPLRVRRRRRWPVAFAVVLALLVVTIAAGAPVVAQRVRTDRADAAATNGLSGVRVFTGLPNDHSERHVDYDPVPPVGGPHDPVWLACGAYDAPVRDENAVHDLEHGAIWITYRPGLAKADVAALAALLPDNGPLSPYVGLPAPVVVSSWGRQLELTGADDLRLPLFIAAFGDGHTSPEPFASCEGGVRETADQHGAVSI